MYFLKILFKSFSAKLIFLNKLWSVLLNFFILGLGNVLNLYPKRDIYTAVSLKKGPSIPKRTIPFVKFPGQNCHIILQIKNSKFFRTQKTTEIAFQKYLEF